MFLKALDPNRNKGYTWLGQHTFTKVPAGTGVGDGPVYINPASANADETLFGVALNGSSRFIVDEDGDVVLAGVLKLDGGNIIVSPTSSYVRFYNATLNNGYVFGGSSIVRSRVSMGTGILGQVSLAANLDQDGLLIKRDVDGGSSYSEAGSLLTLQRDVTNVTSEGGNFLECQNAAGAVLADIDKSGALEISAGFGLDVAPQAQQAHIVDADGQLGDITTKFNTLVADLEGFGFLAAA